MKSVINYILDFLEMLVDPILNLLPDSPFQSITIEDFGPLNMVLSWINYFIPIGAMITFVGSYLSAIIIWYSVRWALRIARYID